MSARLLPMIMTACLLVATPALADVAALQTAWDQAMYVTDGSHREQALAHLADEARVAAAAHPNDASLLIWEGIILSSYAGERGGLGALGLVKEARASLEKAIAREPDALDGSAYTTLGSLYYKVPGWPLGFGSDKKARKNLETALRIDPRSIDANYFMGEFLFQQGDYQEAHRYLVTALHAPARRGRAVADEGRRREVRSLLERVEKKAR